jgi:phospholipid transport system substrate-binding protein
VNLRPIIFLLALLMLPPAAVRAATAQAEQQLQAAVSEVLAAGDAARDHESLIASLRPILHRYISFDTMTRRAVGPGWRQFAVGQQDQAIRLFTTLIIRTYAGKFTPGEHATVKFKAASEPAPGRVEVPTIVLYQGSQYSVIYRLEDIGGWKITDVVIEGVSMVANYRSQFDAEFKKGGAAAVVGALNQSVEHPK